MMRVNTMQQVFSMQRIYEENGQQSKCLERKEALFASPVRRTPTYLGRMMMMMMMIIIMIIIIICRFLPQHARKSHGAEDIQVH